jgi:hypothetical protein
VPGGLIGGEVGLELGHGMPKAGVLQQPAFAF